MEQSSGWEKNPDDLQVIVDGVTVEFLFSVEVGVVLSDVEEGVVLLDVEVGVVLSEDDVGLALSVEVGVVLLEVVAGVVLSDVDEGVVLSDVMDSVVGLSVALELGVDVACVWVEFIDSVVALVVGFCVEFKESVCPSPVLPDELSFPLHLST